MKIKFIRFNWNLILKCQLIILGGILVALMGFLGEKLMSDLKNSGQTVVIKFDKQAPEKEVVSRSRLNGEAVEIGQENLLPTAVMIDNNPEAWPLFGLNSAKVVYNAPVEGVTTRLMALYTPTDGQEVAKIGPVRSTRPYFVAMAHEYGAMLAHSGGSPEALQLIKELKIKNLEEIASWGPDYFSRVYSRTAPHNLFTAGNKLNQAISDWHYGDEPVTYRGWLFQEVKARELITAKQINIYYSAGEIPDVSYAYNTSTDEYLRSQFEKPQIDGLDNKQVAVKNVIIQYVSAEKILDQALRIELNLVGNGQATIFINGHEIFGSWRKNGRDSRTIFYDEAGGEIKFAPGNIWVEIVPGERRVEVK
jgi:hypothetical protein